MLTAILLQITQAGQVVADTANAITGQMEEVPTEITLSLWE